MKKIFFVCFLISSYLHAVEMVYINTPLSLAIPPLNNKHLSDYSLNTKQTPIKSFYIAKYELSVLEYRLYLKQTGQLKKEKILIDLEFEDDEPITNINFFEAKDVCSYYKGRLPTEREWSVAASIKLSKSVCYEHLKKETFFPFSTQHYPLKQEHEVSICLASKNEDFEASGFGRELLGVHDSIENINGTFGMLGNVWEWVSDSKKYFLQDYRVIKGGSYANYQDPLLFDSRVSNFLRPSSHQPNVGFRCVWDTLTKDTP